MGVWPKQTFDQNAQQNERKKKRTNKLSRSDGTENVCERCHFDQPLRRLNYCDQAKNNRDGPKHPGNEMAKCRKYARRQTQGDEHKRTFCERA